MTEADIYRTLTAIFHDVFDDDSIVLRPDMSAAEIAEWDSLNHLNIIAASEIRFGVKFKNAEIEALQNVGDFVGTIGRKLEAAGR